MSALELTAILLSAVAGGAVQASLGFGGSFIMVPAVAVLLPRALPGAVLLGLGDRRGVGRARPRPAVSRPV